MHRPACILTLLLLIVLTGCDAGLIAPAKPAFRYVGEDMHTRRTVTCKQTAQEGKIVVAPPGGREVTMKLSPMLETRHSYRIPLAGINGKEGSLYVHFTVECDKDQSSIRSSLINLSIFCAVALISVLVFWRVSKLQPALTQDSRPWERRKRVLATFTGFFIVGLGLFLFAPEKSLYQDFGLMFMISWLPSVTWYSIWFAKRWAPIKLVPRGISAGAPYATHLHVKATFLEQPVPEEAPAGEKEYPCLLLIGTEGFTGRLWCTGDEKVTWAKEIPVNLKVQFLAPDVAHSRFPPGTVAKILVGRSVTGQVEVLPAPGA